MSNKLLEDQEEDMDRDVAQILQSIPRLLS